MKEKVIPGKSKMVIELEAHVIQYLLNMLATVPAPRKETDIAFIPISKQYDEQFEKINKKLQLVEKDKVANV